MTWSRIDFTASIVREINTNGFIEISISLIEFKSSILLALLRFIFVLAWSREIQQFISLKKLGFVKNDAGYSLQIDIFGVVVSWSWSICLFVQVPLSPWDRAAWIPHFQNIIFLWITTWSNKCQSSPGSGEAEITFGNDLSSILQTCLPDTETLVP